MTNTTATITPCDNHVINHVIKDTSHVIKARYLVGERSTKDERLSLQKLQPCKVVGG